MSTGARTGVTLWSAGSDPVTRAQFQASHQALEAGAVVATVGTLAARPAPSAANAKSFYQDENGTLYWSDGTTWYTVGGAGVERKFANAVATGTVTLNLGAYDTFVLTMTGNVTIAMSNPPSAAVAQRFTLKLIQDATGGRTLTLPASWQPDGGTAPSLSTAAGAVSELDVRTTDGGATYQYRLRWSSAPSAPATQTFNYTGAAQTVTVPAGRTTLTFDLRGASGATAGSNAGLGGRVQGAIAVTPGQVIQVNVGGAGSLTATRGVNVAGGWNGGGAGGASGGGATDLRLSPNGLADRFAVAGGGGGSGIDSGNGGGGGGGYYGGGGGGAGTGLNEALPTAGALGVGGAGGDGNNTGAPAAGSAAGGSGGGTTGGAGANGGPSVTGGGGGSPSAGGAAGANANSANSGGGGGGSSYTAATATGVVHTQGVASGNGVAVLTWS